jgi:hypothetical protein
VDNFNGANQVTSQVLLQNVLKQLSAFQVLLVTSNEGITPRQAIATLGDRCSVQETIIQHPVVWGNIYQRLMVQRRQELQTR